MPRRCITAPQSLRLSARTPVRTKHSAVRGRHGQGMYASGGEGGCLDTFAMSAALSCEAAARCISSICWMCTQWMSFVRSLCHSLRTPIGRSFNGCTDSITGITQRITSSLFATFQLNSLPLMHPRPIIKQHGDKTRGRVARAARVTSIT